MFDEIVRDENSLVVLSPLLKVYVTWPIDYAIITGIAEKDEKFNTENYDQMDFKPFERQNSDDLHDEYISIKMGQTYIIEMVIGNFGVGPLRNIKVPPPNLIFEEYPPLMHGYGGPHEYCKISYITSYTNDTGYYFVEMKFEYGGIGAYIASFDFGASVTIPEPFKTENTLEDIKIITEPDFVNMPYDDPELNATYTGRIFNFKARVRIDVSEGPKDNYIVIAHPKSVSDNDISIEVFPQSLYDLDEKMENYLGWVTIIEGVRTAKTDHNGEATFEFLSVWDISGSNATTKFYFAAGDRHEGMYLRTNLTNSNYTFIPSIDFEIVQQPSKYIAAYSPIDSSPQIKVTSHVRRPFLLMNMQLKELFGRDIHDNYLSVITDRYVTNTLCFAILSSKVDFQNG